MANAFPNLFLVGAMKSGTTTLHRYLDSHPKVFMSPVKEPHYFSFDLWNSPTWDGSLSFGKAKTILSKDTKSVHSCKVREWSDYTWLFRRAKDEKWLGEASTSYLYSKVAARKIREVCAASLILVLLRDPVDRAYSHYLMEYAIGRTRKRFYPLLKEEWASLQKGRPERFGLIGAGMYANQIERFMDAFGNDRLKIFLFDQLRNSPEKILHEVAGFLHIDFAGFSRSRKPLNKGMSPLFPFLNNMLQKSSVKKILREVTPSPFLTAGKRLYYRRSRGLNGKDKDKEWAKEIFAQDIKRTENLIGKNLERWMSKSV